MRFIRRDGMTCAKIPEEYRVKLRDLLHTKPCEKHGELYAFIHFNIIGEIIFAAKNEADIMRPLVTEQEIKAYRKLWLDAYGEFIWALERIREQAQEYSNSKRLQLGDDGLEKLTRYMSKSRETFKRWSGSRNLTRVEPIERDGALSMDEVAELGEAIQDGTAMELIERMFPGYELVRDPEAEPNVINHYWYIQIELRKKKPVPKWGRSRREKKQE